MKLTALDIRKQEFSRTLRGYDPDEVESFIEVISDQWKEMVDELKRDNDRISELELKLEHYHKVEEALEEALQTARTSARQTIVQADVKAKKIVEAAEEDAEKITRDARDHRRDIKREAAKFSVRRKEIVAKLRAFLLSEMEMLAHYDDDDPTGFIRLLGEAAGDGSGQQQLTAGSPVSDALNEEQQQPEEPRQVAPEPAVEEYASSNAPGQEPQYGYDEADARADVPEADLPETDVPEADVPIADALEADAPESNMPEVDAPEANAPEKKAPQSAPVQPVELLQTHVSNQQTEDGTAQHADLTASQATNEAPADESNPSGPDNNDAFQSEYEKMTTIKDVYGQFDASAADDTPADDYAEGDYADGSYAEGEYADDAYPEDAYSDDDYSNDEYTDHMTGDGYAEPGQGTAAQGREYPNQSRPAQDRPPADSPTASGQRAPGMNRPDAHQELSESATEDIEKIRRILEDLDN